MIRRISGKASLVALSGLLLGCSSFLQAGTIFADSDNTQNGLGVGTYQDDFGDHMVVQGFGWASTESYSDVSIGIQLDPDQNGTNALYQVWLTNAIGPAATVANQIAKYNLNPDASGNLSVDTGLDLGPGNYYVLISSTTEYAGLPLSFNPPTVGSGITALSELYSANTPPTDFAPSDSFYDSTAGNGFSMIFDVTGDQGGGSQTGAPEPATAALLAASLSLLVFRAALVRRKHAVAGRVSIDY